MLSGIFNLITESTWKETFVIILSSGKVTALEIKYLAVSKINCCGMTKRVLVYANYRFDSRNAAQELQLIENYYSPLPFLDSVVVEIILCFHKDCLIVVGLN